MKRMTAHLRILITGLILASSVFSVLPIQNVAHAASGNYLSYNGSAYLVHNTAPDAFGTNNASGAIEVWFKSSSTLNNQTLFSSVDKAAGLRYLWFRITQTTGLISVAQTNNDPVDIVNGVTNVCDGLWHHLIVSSDGASYTLFVDSIPEPLTVAGGANSGDWFSKSISRDSISMGAFDSTSVINYAIANMANARVYSRPMTQTEARANYLNGRHGSASNSTGLIFNLPLTEGSGNPVDTVGGLVMTNNSTSWVAESGVEPSAFADFSDHRILAFNNSAYGYYGEARNEWYLTADNSSLNTYGLIYPVTYAFSVPSNAGKAFYKYSSSSNYTQLTNRLSTELFNGVQAARFDYSTNITYLSIPFGDTSNEVYVKITDNSSNPVNSKLLGITKYYDNRKSAAVFTMDDWGSSTGEALFDQAFTLFQSNNIWVTPAIIVAYVDGGQWAVIQNRINSGYIEPASHSYDHPLALPYADYDLEVGGSKSDIIGNVTMPSLNTRNGQEYLYAWVAPAGLTDSTLRQKLGQYDYLSDTAGSALTAYGYFPKWDVSNSTYGTWNRWRTDSSNNTADLNNRFDIDYAAGRIYHLGLHPADGLYSYAANSTIAQHLAYVGGRSDVWYAGEGHIFAYHYVGDRGVVNTNGLTVGIIGDTQSHSLSDYAVIAHFQNGVNMDFSKVASNGTNMGFFASDQSTRLPFLITSWNATDGYAVVNVSSIPSDSFFTSYIYYTYGNVNSSNETSSLNNVVYSSDPTVTFYEPFYAIAPSTWISPDTKRLSVLRESSANWTADGYSFGGAGGSVNFTVGRDITNNTTVVVRQNFAQTSYNVTPSLLDYYNAGFSGSQYIRFGRSGTPGQYWNEQFFGITNNVGDFIDLPYDGYISSDVNYVFALTENASANLWQFWINGTAQNTTDTTTNGTISSMRAFGGSKYGLYTGVASDLIIYNQKLNSSNLSSIGYELNWRHNTNNLYYGGSDPPPSLTTVTGGVTMDKDGLVSGVSGNLTSLGGYPTLDGWFDYGLTNAYGSSTSNVSYNTTGIKSVSISGLTPGQTYHYRFNATNGDGTTKGLDSTFTLTMPSVTTGTPTNVGSTATLNANISSMGVASSTYAYFQWWYDGGAINTTPLQTKNAIGAVTQSITFDPNKVLNTRIVATVGSVSVYGSTTTLPGIQGNSFFKTFIPILFGVVVAFVILSIVFSVGITIQGLALVVVGGTLAYYVVSAIVNLLF